MKNYIRDVINHYIKYDYPERINHDFRAWLIDGEHSQEKEYELNKLWENTEAMTTPGYQRSLEQMRELTGIEERQKNRILHTHLFFYKVAVILLVMVSSISIYCILQYQQTSDLLQIYVPTADLRNVTLSDGTEVMMNSQSTLLYPTQFTGNTRSVYLVGEANFKVARDEKHPFVVKTTDFQVTALGTEFNIAAYPEEEEIETTLISGKVSVKYNKQEKEEILKPDERLTYNKQSGVSKKHPANIEDVTAWQRGDRVFRGKTLEEIFTQLERYYPYTFVYSFHSLKKDKFNFTFGGNATLEEIMDIISRVTGYLNYKIVDNQCYVSTDNKKVRGI